MAVPARPTSGAPVGTDWGQVAHDTAVAQDIQAGQTTTTHSGNATSNAVTVVFPRPFASPPRVTFGCSNFNYAAAANGSPPTASQVVVQTYRISGVAATGSVVVDWVAVGPRA